MLAKNKFTTKKKCTDFARNLQISGKTEFIEPYI